MIRKLHFDSHLFDLQVGKLEGVNKNFRAEHKNLIKYDLVYVFCYTKMDDIDNQLVDV